MAKVFVLEGKRAGQTIRLAERYTFIDGVMVEEDDDTAKMKATILCTIYPCKMMDHADYVKMKSTPVPVVEPVQATAPVAKVEVPEPPKVESAKPTSLSAKAVQTTS